MMFLLIISCIVNNFLFQQGSYKVKVDDFTSKESYCINIKENLVNNNAYILLNKDTLRTINNVVQINKVGSIDGIFLRIDYQTFGGVSEHIVRTKLFLLKGRKLYEPLSLISQEIFYNSRNQLEEKYTFDIRLLHIKGRYFIKGRENDVKPLEKINFTQSHRLLFDKYQMVFYSEIINEKKQLSLCDSQKHLSVTKIFEIKVRDGSYIYVNNNWYSASKNYDCIILE